MGSSGRQRVFRKQVFYIQISRRRVFSHFDRASRCFCHTWAREDDVIIAFYSCFRGGASRFLVLRIPAFGRMIRTDAGWLRPTIIRRTGPGPWPAVSAESAGPEWWNGLIVTNRLNSSKTPNTMMNTHHGIRCFFIVISPAWPLLILPNGKHWSVVRTVEQHVGCLSDCSTFIRYSPKMKVIAIVGCRACSNWRLMPGRAIMALECPWELLWPIWENACRSAVGAINRHRHRSDDCPIRPWHSQVPIHFFVLHLRCFLSIIDYSDWRYMSEPDYVGRVELIHQKLTDTPWLLLS